MTQRRRQTGGSLRRWTITPAGLCWLATTAALIVLALFKNINLLALLGYVMLAAWVLSLPAAGRGLARLRVRRRVAGPVYAGMPCAVRVTVVNEGRRPALGLRLEDRGPHHALTWFVSRLECGGRRTLRGEVVLPQRGRYAWDPLIAASAAPLGLVVRRILAVPAEEIIVLPRMGWLHRGRFREYLRSRSPRNDRVRIRQLQRHRAAQDEFHGLRGFRPGDSPRSIHWRTSARLGELMVREYEDVPSDNLILVLDPSPAGAPDDAVRLEAAVSLAATICREWCRRKGDRLVAAVVGPDPQVLDGVTSSAHARRVLEALAVVGAGAAGAPALLARLAAVPLPPAAVVLVATGPSALPGALERALNRPVTCLDASDLSAQDFYRIG